VCDELYSAVPLSISHFHYCMCRSESLMPFLSTPRCRKKTKRQGKMNTRQQASSSVIPILQSLYRSHANPRRSSHNESESQATLPTATLPARQSPHGSPKGSGIEVQSTTNQVYVAPPPPPKSMRIIASPPRLMH
jgi:hypothetical protein